LTHVAPVALARLGPAFEAVVHAPAASATATAVEAHSHRAEL
jgi:hypothetical protein